MPQILGDKINQLIFLVCGETCHTCLTQLGFDTFFCTFYSFFFFLLTLCSFDEGTTSYENGDMKVIVTTSEIAHEEEENPIEKSAPLPAVSIGVAEKKHNLPVSKKKAFKKSTKGRSRTKLVSKRERRKGKINGKRKRS